MTVQIIPVNDDKAPVFDHKGIFKKIALRSVLIPIPLALLIWLISVSYTHLTLPTKA